MQLDDRLLENFCALYRSVSAFDSACSFTQPLTRDELSNLTLLLSYECPELLQFSAAEEITYYSDSDDHSLAGTVCKGIQRVRRHCQNARAEHRRAERL